MARELRLRLAHNGNNNNNNNNNDNNNNNKYCRWMLPFGALVGRSMPLGSSVPHYIYITCHSSSGQSSREQTQTG
jgi:hypothetical protein